MRNDLLQGHSLAPLHCLGFHPPMRNVLGYGAKESLNPASRAPRVPAVDDHLTDIDLGRRYAVLDRRKFMPCQPLQESLVSLWKLVVEEDEDSFVLVRKRAVVLVLAAFRTPDLLPVIPDCRVP